MNSITDFIFANANHAHWIIFGSLILAGLNVPISEDLMVIISAILASKIVPENLYVIFFWLFLGCYISDWMVYWIGRLLRFKLFKFKWFAKTFPKKKLSQVRLFYKKYGFITLLLGRFIPFGVRNCLFLTAGMTKMNFGKFLLSDGIACFTSNITLFFITFSLGKNHQAIFAYLKKLNLVIFVVFVVTIIGIIWYYKKKKCEKQYD